MLEPHFTKSAGEKFKHEITAELRGISLIWMLSHCAHDVGGMWMSPTLLVGLVLVEVPGLLLIKSKVK